MLKFEEYLTDFTNSVNLLDFIINLIVATLLGIIVKAFYVRYGQSFSNKEKFASIFVPLALSTLLIITVVQASIALSLGLVGALSIVRFRAAIKEPEELTYLFLIIGIGITCGANKPILAVIAILLILIMIFLNQNVSKKKTFVRDQKLVNIRTASTDIKAVTSALSSMPYLELKRMEENQDGLFLTYLTKMDTIDDIAAVRSQLKGLDDNIKITIIDQPELVL